MTLRQQQKSEIDAAIANGVRPTVPRQGIGMVLASGPRSRKILVNNQGTLTPAGRYYYEQANEEPPRGFSFSQRPTRRARSLYIRLLDGSSRAISRPRSSRILDSVANFTASKPRNIPFCFRARWH